MMRKAESETYYARGQYWPTINVKWHPFLPDIANKYRTSGHEFSGDDAFWEWTYREWGADHSQAFEIADELARDDGWKAATELACDIFGSRVKVYAEGRSGGHLVVDGLPPVEEDWDAIAVGKWSRFAGSIEQIMDHLDYSFIWHLHVNVYEAWSESFV